MSWAINYPQAGLHPVSQLWHPGALGISSCLQSILKGLDFREKKMLYDIASHLVFCWQQSSSINQILIPQFLEDKVYPRGSELDVSADGLTLLRCPVIVHRGDKARLLFMDMLVISLPDENFE